MTNTPIRATLIPGDGIGPEIMEATLKALEALQAPFEWDVQTAGLAAMQTTGDALPPATMESIRSTRLALNYKSEYLLELGSDILNPALDRVVDSQKQVDFSFAYQINKQLQLQFEAANLNNEKYYVYQGVKNHNAQYEQYGRTYKITLKASLFQ